MNFKEYGDNNKDTIMLLHGETRFVKDIFCLSECYESREK